MIIAEIILIWH